MYYYSAKPLSHKCLQTSGSNETWQANFEWKTSKYGRKKRHHFQSWKIESTSLAGISDLVPKELSKVKAHGIKTNICQFRTSTSGDITFSAQMFWTNLKFSLWAFKKGESTRINPSRTWMQHAQDFMFDPTGNFVPKNKLSKSKSSGGTFLLRLYQLHTYWYRYGKSGSTKMNHDKPCHRPQQ